MKSKNHSLPQLQLHSSSHLLAKVDAVHSRVLIFIDGINKVTESNDTELNVIVPQFSSAVVSPSAGIFLTALE